MKKKNVTEESLFDLLHEIGHLENNVNNMTRQEDNRQNLVVFVAGYRTVGDVITHIDRKEDLLKIRNLGRKSADEIMKKIFYYQYTIMTPEKQEKYMHRVLELNEFLIVKMPYLLILISLSMI